VHAALKAARVTVNAIAIEESEPELTAYFFENLIVGEGAFVETAFDFEDYPEKIRRKLLREVTRQTAGIAAPQHGHCAESGKDLTISQHTKIRSEDPTYDDSCQ
jgi:Ca-activated chloride channel family protein